TVAPRGAYMAVGIPFGERGYYFFGPFQGYVATFDLVTQTKVGEFFIDEDVYRTLVTDDGYAIVAGGSGQWSALHMMNARNGTVSPRTATIWQYSSIALHPSESRSTTWPISRSSDRRGSPATPRRCAFAVPSCSSSKAPRSSRSTSPESSTTESRRATCSRIPGPIRSP